MLYLIKPHQDWEPWYDKVFGFLIRAKSSEQARLIASKQAGDEGSEVWLNPELTSCLPIFPSGPTRIILRDKRSA